MLHITNGDATLKLLKASGLYGDFLAWRDCLHEGPVPSSLSLESLSQVRARFIGSWGLADEEETHAAFEERDRALAEFHTHEEVVLWFEHDLYDQLQLIQILDWLSRRNDRTRLSLICIDRYEGIERFIGLSQLTPSELNALFDERHEVFDEEFWAARDGWTAFTADSPFRLTDLLETEKLRGLPFLEKALRRHLTEYPSIVHGLSHTELLALTALKESAKTYGDVFEYIKANEKAPFWGDSLLYKRLSLLENVPTPLISSSGAPRAETALAITERGREVLEGRADHVKLNGIDRWLGGVHLRHDQIWRWDGRKLHRV